MDSIRAFLEHKAYMMRYWSILMTTQAESGHVTSALSAADIVATLFFYAMRYNPRNYNDRNNDRFILSKGHAVPIVYAAWKEVGVLSEQDILGYRTFDSVLEGHPTRRFEYSEAATGSLGMGLSIGVGEALSARLDKLNFRTYVLMGDSEVAEGSVWEAAQLAAFYKLNNLTAIIDDNRLGQSTQTMEGHDTSRYQKMFEAFGWYTKVVNGHDVAELMKAFDECATIKDKPSIIIAKTFKGYGVDAVENKENYHGKAFSKKELPNILEQLKTRFSSAAAYKDTSSWRPRLPEGSENVSTVKPKTADPDASYKKGEHVATRKAYGEALKAIGADASIVALDAEVKNSTYAEIFEAQYPDRFFQCFIAEQNMVGMAIGLERRGKIPFASTFGVFLTRAHDQIRMAAVGKAAVRMVGSHAGISIGQDGPSQMALEDIAMFRALPDSVVLYPSDATSTWELVKLMHHHSQGISYLRTTREATPVLYGSDEEFRIGGCKVLRHDKRDKVCVIAAGITVHEALKAYDQLVLQNEQVFVTVIDLYSIKPFDRELVEHHLRAVHNNVVIVEDHYAQGGIGEMIMAEFCDRNLNVKHLAVRELPRSGKPEELLAWAQIDAQTIVNAVLHLIG